MFEATESNHDPELPDSIKSLMAVFTLLPSVSEEEDNILAYIAGYICRKLSPKVCTDCQTKLSGTINRLDPSHHFLREKQYDGTKKGGLAVPSTALTAVCTEAESLYRKHCEQVLHLGGIRSRLVSAISKGLSQDHDIACSNKCATLKLIINLFINIRLHHTLKDNNCEFSSSTGKKNRKLLKLQHI